MDVLARMTEEEIRRRKNLAARVGTFRFPNKRDNNPASKLRILNTRILILYHIIKVKSPYSILTYSRLPFEA